MANRNLPTHYRTSTLVKWVAELRFGKCRQAYFYKGLQHYWQRKNLPTHYRTSTLRLYIFTITFSGECLHCFTKRNLYYRVWRITRTLHKEICIAIEFLLRIFLFRQSPKSKKGLPASLCLRKKREITSYHLVNSLLTLKQSFNDALTSLRSR